MKTKGATTPAKTGKSGGSSTPAQKPAAAPKKPAAPKPAASKPAPKPASAAKPAPSSKKPKPEAAPASKPATATTSPKKPAPTPPSAKKESTPKSAPAKPSAKGDGKSDKKPDAKKPAAKSGAAESPAPSKGKGAPPPKTSKGSAAAAVKQDKAPAKPASGKTAPSSSKSAPADAKGKGKPEAPAAKGKAPVKSAKDADKPATPVKTEPRFKRFFTNNSDDGKAAALKLAQAAGLTKLKDEGRRIAAEPAAKRLTKSPLSKKDRDHYKEILMRKRSQLVGDVTGMETEALTGGSGSLSSLPQHMADAGSDTYDQSLNLDLAAGQRKLLREIDDALVRIADNTFGICEYLGVPISPERLENTPWARYSIEGAREMEHQGLM